MGYVYVICVENTSFRKVGHASRDVKSRLDSLQIGCPYPLILEYSVKTELYTEVERIMHAALARFHKQGEWFDVSLDVVMDHLHTIETLLEDEELLPRVKTDPEPDTALEVLPNSQRKCPLCNRIMAATNIRRHMRSCADLMSV